MNYDDFFNQANFITEDVTLENSYSRNTLLLNNEALFQLPLISMIVLLMAKDKRKPRVSEIGQLVGESIEASMPGFKGSAQHIEWSANLRIRTVKAISFLERADLIEVSNRKGKIGITELGKKVINKAASAEDNLAINLAQIARSYRNICISKQLSLEL